MATAAQVSEMLDMMKHQMARLDELQKENDGLRQRTTLPSELKPKRPDRPVIEGNLSDSEWALFLDTWGRYKVMTGLKEIADIRMELRAACSNEVNKLLFEFVGATPLDGASEDELLGHIKGIAVKGLHKEVHRVNFGKLKQGDNENITHFVARLKAQASLCSFNVECPCGTKVSFAEEMVSQQLVAGLLVSEHQSKLLSEANTLTTLQAKVERLQSLEATAESATKLHVPGGSTSSTSGAAKSAYRKGNETKKNREKKQGGAICQLCGRNNHYGRSMAPKDCPAQKKKCNKCEKEGHFGKMCKAEKSVASAGVEETEEGEDEISEASSAYFFATHIEEDGTDFQKGPMNTTV